MAPFRTDISYPCTSSFRKIGDYRNPTAVDYLLPLYNSDDQVRAACQELDHAKVAWIVEDSILQRNLDRHDGRFQALEYSVFDEWPFFKYLRTNYVEVARFGDYAIYHRRE